MSPIKDRSVSTENARGALVTEYQRYEESVLREKSYALNMADRELIRLAVLGVSGFLCLGRLFQGQPNEAALCI